MGKILTTALLGFFAGTVGTGMGGLIGICISKPSNRFLAFLLGFSAGIMIIIVTLDLIPEAIEIGGLVFTLIGIILGTALIMALDFFTINIGFYETSNPEFSKIGLLLGIGIAMHNLPEGLAIGSGYISAKGYGISLATVMALHNLAEGLAMAVPLNIEGVGRKKILLYSILAGSPMGIGAIIGSILGLVSPMFIAVCLGFAGGTMFYITCGELLPNANKLSKGSEGTLGVTLGVIIGILLCNFFIVE